MENEKIGKKILKKIQNKERSIKKKEDPNWIFFSIIFLSK
jgi:hypothetical protein